MSEAALFADLESSAAFRADMLYFLRLAGNYAANIFVDVRNRAPMKHRKAFDDWLSKHQCKDDALNAALKDRHQWFDAHKVDFTIILGEMPHYLRERLGRALQHDHAMPLDHRAFIACLDDMRDYRHRLEHFGDPKQKQDRRHVSDERLLHILGLMLLPFLGNHLLGRIRHHARRRGYRPRAVEQVAGRAKEILDVAIADRREASRFINGLKRRIDNDTIRNRIMEKYGNAPSDTAVHRIAREEASKRRDLEDRKSALLTLHRAYFADGHWPRYNYENFLIRFGFIGRRRIEEMEQFLRDGRDENETLDFILHIEPLFMLSMDIALIIHCWLSELEAPGVPIKDTKKLQQTITAAKTIVAIRNATAHGGWVWAVTPRGEAEPLPFEMVLSTLLAVLDHPNVNDKAQWKNDLLTAIEGALRPVQWSRIHAKPQPGDDPNRMPAAITVKRWTAGKRVAFADKDKWGVNKRKPLRRVAAMWMRDIAALRSDKLKEN
ncbi:MAG: hypothetical protein AABZ45_04145 [Pseudomonadota bacterium]